MIIKRLFVRCDSSVEDLAHTFHVSGCIYRPAHDSSFLVNFSAVVHASRPLCICGKGLVVKVIGSFIVLWYINPLFVSSSL